MQVRVTRGGQVQPALCSTTEPSTIMAATSEDEGDYERIRMENIRKNQEM